jgi:hypothetical protein
MYGQEVHKEAQQVLYLCMQFQSRNDAFLCEGFFTEEAQQVLHLMHGAQLDTGLVMYLQCCTCMRVVSCSI